MQTYADPEVGLGVTIPSWTDRDAGTVIEIMSPSRIRVQMDKVHYEYPSGRATSIERDPEGSIVVAKRVTHGRFKGQWRIYGQPIMLGVRDPHYDYSF